MKLLRYLGLFLAPLVASATLLSINRSRVNVVPPAIVDTGSIIGTGTIDEVNDLIRCPTEGQAINVGGGTAMAYSVWLKPHATANTEPASECNTGPGYDWPDGNIWFDRDNLGETRDYGCALSGGRVCCSVENSGGSQTAFATTDITDNLWHHIVFQRITATGVMGIWVDSVLEVETTGPTGTIALNPGVCEGAECDTVYLTEKHGFSVAGYIGSIGPIEVWNIVICSGATCAVPSAPSAPGASGLVGQYNLGEGSGTVVGDTTANNNDCSIAAGGVPAWSNDSPY